MLRFINIVVIFLFVAPIFAQSQNHPVSGTKYAPVYNVKTGDFLGWEGVDGTFVTPEGVFYDSVVYNGVEVHKDGFFICDYGGC
jgi:hypothetical protein